MWGFLDSASLKWKIKMAIKSIDNYIVDMFSQAKKCLQIPNSSKYVFVGLCLGLYRVLFGEKFLKFTIKNIFKRDFETNLNKKLGIDTMSSLITLIHYADHTSMAFSIESRMPFMDYRLVEFLASVPACYKMRDGWTKYLARLAFDGKLPDEINWRKDKMGWPIPEKKWFYGNLNRWFIENIESCKLSKKLSFKEKENKRFSNNIKRMNLSIWEKSFLNNLD